MARILPALAAQITQTCDAWIVGSAANINNALKDDIKDIDIAVPYEMWHHASLLIPNDAKRNTFAGWKCVSEGKVIDIWPENIGRLLTSSFTTHVWHPRSGFRYCRV